MLQRFFFCASIHLHQINGKTPPKREECGWDQPAPQFSALEIEIADVEKFADNVAFYTETKVVTQHWFDEEEAKKTETSTWDGTI